MCHVNTVHCICVMSTLYTVYMKDTVKTLDYKNLAICACKSIELFSAASCDKKGGRYVVLCNYTN